MHSEGGFTFDDIFFGMKRLLGTHRIPHSQHGLPTAAGISFIWDKLTGLSGVARAVAEETRDLSFADLWGRHFMEDLCQRMYPQEEIVDRRGAKSTPLMGKALGTVRRPNEYRVPSWSWVSLDGPVRHIPPWYSRLVSEVIKCSTTPAGKDFYERKTNVGYRSERLISTSRPTKALILQSKEFQPKHNEDGTKDTTTLVSKRVVTTSDVNYSVAQNPHTKSFTFQALFDVVRVGVGVFVKADKKSSDARLEKEPEAWDEAKNGKLTLDKILHVSKDESWGPITEDDAKMWVSIV
ncbi:hypothetical protein GGR53DRAFT_528157 [Hypoxylon sp. FL1150]|nr:hypothetical protein GGR53DRAFT_528157 [Hypoxylon sp. FL1150]